MTPIAELAAWAAAILTGATGVGGLLWKLYIEAQVKALVTEATGSSEHARNALREEILHSREDQLIPLRTGIDALGTELAKLKDGILDPSELHLWRQTRFDASEATRIRVFFWRTNGGGRPPELHELRNHVAPIPGLVTTVERMQAELQELRGIVQRIDGIQDRKRRQDEDTERDLAAALKDVQAFLAKQKAEGRGA